MEDPEDKTQRQKQRHKRKLTISNKNHEPDTTSETLRRTKLETKRYTA